MVAILGVRHDEMKGLCHPGLPAATQLLGLLYPYFNLRLLAGHSPHRDRGCPTAPSLRRPSQYRVRMTDDHRTAVQRLGGAVDILSLSHRFRRQVRPGCAIQREHLPSFGRNLLHQVTFQPCSILSFLLNGGVRTGPLAAKGGREAQFRKGVDGWAEKQHVH